jgi:hypothetical protein
MGQVSEIAPPLSERFLVKRFPRTDPRLPPAESISNTIAPPICELEFDVNRERTIEIDDLVLASPGWYTPVLTAPARSTAVFDVKVLESIVVFDHTFSAPPPELEKVAEFPSKVSWTSFRVPP